MKIEHPPEVRLRPVAHEKLACWTRIADGEISGLGTVREVRRDGRIAALRIDDVHLLRQQCSAGSTELESDAVASHLHRAAAEGVADRVRLWWHSHAEMDTFWSGTDVATIEETGGAPYWLSLVCNKKGDRRLRLDVFEPIRITVDELPWHVEVPKIGVEEFCREEYEEKVLEYPRRRPAIQDVCSRFQDPDPHDPEDYLRPEMAAIAGRLAPRHPNGAPLDAVDFIAENRDPFDDGGHR